jgi:ABC-2 type transport system permease protein
MVYLVALRSLVEYRVDFTIAMLAALCTELAALSFYWVVFTHARNLGPWSSGGVLLLFAMTALIAGIAEAFFNGIWALPEYVVSGELDRMLLYPVDELRLILVARPAPHAFGTIAGALALLGFCWSRLALPLGALLLVPIWAVSGAVIYTGALVLVGCSSFSLPGQFSHHFMLVRRILNAARYPLSIYPAGLRVALLTLFPVGVAVFLPVEALLGMAGSSRPLAFVTPPAVAGLSFCIARATWRRCLRRYQSTGS